jgi:hypothetical protein
VRAASAIDPVTGLRRRQVDALIAGVLAAWAVLEALFLDGPGPLVVRIGFALAVTLPLVWRRRAPLPVLALISALLVLRALTADAPESGTAPFPSLLVATFSVACHVAPLALAAPAPALPIAAMRSPSPATAGAASPVPATSRS